MKGTEPEKIGRTSDHDACLTPVKETGKEEELGGRIHGLHRNYRKHLSRPMEVLELIHLLKESWVP